MTTLYDAETNLVALLQAKLTDPFGRSDNTWINNSSYTTKRPTNTHIFVNRAGGTNPSRRIGSYKQDYGINYNVVVVVPMGAKGTFGGSRTYSGTALLNKVCDDIASVLETNATSITGVKWAKRVSGGGYYPNHETKCYVCPMVFELWVENV